MKCETYIYFKATLITVILGRSEFRGGTVDIPPLFTRCTL